MDVPKIEDSQTMEILKLPNQYSLSGSFRFGFAYKDEKFYSITERLDFFVTDLRNRMIEKIVAEMNLGVKFTD